MRDSKIQARRSPWSSIACLVVAASGCADAGHAPAMSDVVEASSARSWPRQLPASNLEVRPQEAIALLPMGAGSDVAADEVCASDVFETTLSPVNLFLMVDRSGSMSQDNKWRQAVGGLRQFLTDPQTAGLRVGLRFFSDDEPMAGCTMQGCNIDACAEPLVQIGALAAESGSNDIQELRLVKALENTLPRSGLGTPIYPALGGALQWASIYRTEHPNERTVVVLVTDGEPNGCNQDIGDISELAARAAANFGIATYAIGLHGSNEAQLDQIARAGTTNDAIFIGANAESELLKALNTIRGQTMSCDFALPQSTTGEAVDPSQVNVTLSSQARSVDLFRVDSEADCAADAAAWYYDDLAVPRRVHLCPSVCQGAGQAADVQVTMGCAQSRRDPQSVR